jgi:hypothetical protein
MEMRKENSASHVTAVGSMDDNFDQSERREITAAITSDRPLRTVIAAGAQSRYHVRAMFAASGSSVAERG